jgi:histidinol-phosphate phosphatase family protein
VQSTCTPDTSVGLGVEGLSEETTINSIVHVSQRLWTLVLSRAVFLDRDGVLTRDRQDYVKTPEELEILPGIDGPLREIRNRGFQIVIVTNQSAVGRGLASREEMSRIHEKLRVELAKKGCSVDAIYYCPHRPEERCSCRKPEPGLILEAARDLGIDVPSSWMIGDKEIDLEAARRAGCHGFRVQTNGNGLGEAVQAILTAENLQANGLTP